jgi:hypothetical protein
MLSIHRCSLAASLLLAAAATSQEIVYYKFESTGGNRVVNYAAATSPAPEEGKVYANDASPFVSPGKFGIAALRGGGPGVYHNIDTGWNGALSSSFSVGWFVKQRYAPSGANHFFAAGPALRCFTGGDAGRGVVLRGWGGAPADLTLNADIQTAAATGWVHLTVIVDTSAGLATWYVDGVAQTPIPITGSVSVAAGASNFLVNSDTTASSSYYDVDEFRIHGNAVSAAIALRWATVHGAADSPFGKGCNGKLDNAGTRPTVGNAAYALAFSGPANATVGLALGSDRLALGYVPLPFDLGYVVPSLAGCAWESSSQVWLPGTTNGNGSGSVSLPIPANPSLNGYELFAQALLVAYGPAYATTNPFAIAIGL